MPIAAKTFRLGRGVDGEVAVGERTGTVGAGVEAGTVVGMGRDAEPSRVGAC